MIENTYLGMKYSEQHCHDLESDAANWELAKQCKEESAISDKPAVSLPGRKMVLKLAVAIVIMAIIGIVLISMELPGYAQTEELPSPEPTLTWSGSMESSSDAMPSINLRE